MAIVNNCYKLILISRNEEGIGGEGVCTKDMVAKDLTVKLKAYYVDFKSSKTILNEVRDISAYIYRSVTVN